MKVFCYFNLHKKVWSVKCLESKHPMRGRVIAHKRLLTLTNATPKVSEKGRQRVLQEGVKNVHAGIVGDWDVMDSDFNVPTVWAIHNEITYNPYKYQTFVFKDDNRVQYHGSDYAVLDADDRSVHVYDVMF